MRFVGYWDECGGWIAVRGVLYDRLASAFGNVPEAKAVRGPEGECTVFIPFERSSILTRGASSGLIPDGIEIEWRKDGRGSPIRSLPRYGRPDVGLLRYARALAGAADRA